MNTKKQLDRLFKEQFRNLDVSPPPVVWENIAAALQKKEKTKRVVPLWYKLAGVAAALLVFFTLGGIFYTPFSGTEITSEDIETPIPSEIISPTENNAFDSTQQEIVINESQENPSFSNNDSSLEQEKTFSKETKNSSPSSISSSSEAIVKSNKTTVSISEKEEIPIKKSTPQTISEKEIIAQIVAPNKNSEKINATKTNEVLDANSTQQEIETLISDTDTKTETEVEVKVENKKSLIDYIAEKNEPVVTVSENTLENRWEVAPNVAPVYYSSLGNGSSIDPQFSESSKSGDVNLSYGVKVSYAINEKLSIRTGINKVDLSYTTNDIEFAVASASDGLQSINSKGKGYAIAVGPRGSLQQPPSSIPTVSDDGTVIVPRNGIIPGTMQQELDYFEIPLELKYNLLNKRFGLNIVGGMSTLLLNNNQVSVLSDGFQTEIGSANNLNDLSFSTNVGLGFDYKLSNRFIFNLEPMFKYQLNPYSDSNIDFKPFYLGVYSGFSYRF